jgi:hypothetical protein
VNGDKKIIVTNFERNTNPNFPRRTGGNQENPRMTSFRTNIGTRNLPNMKYEYEPLHRTVCWLECGQELLNILAPAVTLQTYIQEMSDYTLGRDTSYNDCWLRGLPQFLRKNARIIPSNMPQPFLPHPFQFIIRCHPIIRRVDK